MSTGKYVNGSCFPCRQVPVVPVTGQPDRGVQRVRRLQADAEEALPWSSRLRLRVHAGHVTGPALRGVRGRRRLHPFVGVEDYANAHQVEGARQRLHRCQVVAPRDLQGRLCRLGWRHQAVGLTRLPSNGCVHTIPSF